MQNAQKYGSQKESNCTLVTWPQFCTSSDNVCSGVHVWSVVQSCSFLRALHLRCKCSLTPPYTSLTVVFICLWCSALHYFFYNEEHLTGWISTLSIARQRTKKLADILFCRKMQSCRDASLTGARKLHWSLIMKMSKFGNLMLIHCWKHLQQQLPVPTNWKPLSPIILIPPRRAAGLQKYPT